MWSTKLATNTTTAESRMGSHSDAMVTILKSLNLFLRPGQIGLRLLPDDVEEVADAEVDIDQMQSPVRLDLCASHQITADVVDARIRGHAVDGHLEIRCILVGGAFSREEAKRAHIRRIDGLTSRGPRTRWCVAHDQVARRRQIGMQRAAPA